ncbi:MAG: PASTA domain-containing protein [Muribaculaceae bacterium]|jgi:beta-lactam-binding protein with PASTA domain|nr:PASTA domain-containing protein [Muribaculaceae bacterium]MBQ5723932.1 PASTA domain-containing protein [Muribaculaceae bacterium]MBR4886010.1 PASTA domain-containing protein [Muribaculaceae bacterium]MBR5787787.1 PASTA domain-containing protein [Muribaculaceae bacterium]
MSSLLRKYPILVNLVIIILVAILGILIANFSLAIFTKHGEYSVVPSVEKMSYSSAIDQLHAEGFKVEISDSVFRDDLRPGYVLEQNPTANSKVKPGRTVYLVINAVNAKQVAINNIEGISLRQGKAMLQGLGFKDKNIKVVYRLGKHENLIQSVRVDGKKLRPGQRVPVSSVIVLEVSDGRVGQLTDSLLNVEFGVETVDDYAGEYPTEYSEPTEEPVSTEEPVEEVVEEEGNSLME